MTALFKHWTLRSRIRVAFMVLIVVAVTFTGGGCYLIAADIVEDHAIKLGHDALLKTKQMLDDRLRQITVSLMTLMIGDAFKAMIRDVASGDSSHYHTHLTSLQPLFAQMQLSEPMAQTVLVSTPIGDFYNTGYGRDGTARFAASDVYAQLQADSSSIWIPAHADPFFTNHERVVTYAMEPISEIPVSDVYILVNIVEDRLIDVLNMNAGESGGQYVLLDAGGNEVLRSARGSYAELIADSSFIQSLHAQGTATANFDYMRGNDEYIVHAAAIDIPDGWMLVSIQRKSELLGQMHRIQWIVVLVTIACVLIAILLSRMLMAIFFKPLHNLNELMRRVEHNDLSARFISPHSDEFSRVGLRFNQMMEQISTLIETVKAVEKEKAQAELKALQAHISPHFLYNTFHTIYWRCQLNRTEDVGEMVLALSRMFQLGLNDGEAVTTLDKEISHVKQYLHIQQQCYEQLFEYEIQVGDDALLGEPILKLVLQPLVENSILHGFANRRSGGYIRIEVERVEAAMRIAVVDNGEGMDADAVMAAVTQPKDAGDSSYALFNIYHRLQLAYDERMQFGIASIPHVATTITFIIPLEEGAAAA